MLTRITTLTFVATSLLMAVSMGSGLTQDELTVLDRPQDEMMSLYLTRLVDDLFERREERLSRLETEGDWRARAEEIRSLMSRWANLPDRREPLNARVTGRVEREG